MIIGRNENRAVQASLNADGGCVDWLSVGMPDGRTLDVWTQRAAEPFHMRGCWPGDQGRFTDRYGNGGVLTVKTHAGIADLSIGPDDNPDGHPNRLIHGILPRYPWKKSRQGEAAVLKFTTRKSAGHPDLVNTGVWPRHRRVEDTYSIVPDDLNQGFLGALRCDFVLHNTDKRVQPASRCFHAQWNRSLGGAMVTPLVKFAATGVYPKNDAGMLCPLGPPHGITPEFDFSQWKPVPDDLDHGFCCADTVEMRWPNVPGLIARIRRSKEFGHVVIYSPTEQGPFYGHVCLEWQTAAPNATALYALGVPDTGLVMLKPGEELKSWWQVEFWLDYNIAQ